MTPGEWAALLASIGAGAILLKTFEALYKWIGGKAGRERDMVAYERTRASAADARADAADRELEIEARVRRKTQEYAARLRRDLIERGADPSDLPPWPSELIDR
jgi:hypothetical protein